MLLFSIVTVTFAEILKGVQRKISQMRNQLMSKSSLLPFDDCLTTSTFPMFRIAQFVTERLRSGAEEFSSGRGKSNVPRTAMSLFEVAFSTTEETWSATSRSHVMDE